MTASYVVSSNNGNRRIVSIHCPKAFMALLLGGVAVMLAIFSPIFSVDLRQDKISSTLKESPKRDSQEATPPMSDDDPPLKINNSRSDDDTRPIFVFHLGPPKTATSSIQSFLKRPSYQEQFHLDNYETKDNVKFAIELKACFKKNDLICYKPYLEEFVRMEANIIVSDENIINLIGKETFVNFFFALQEHFQVHVVLFYRRQFDILVSRRKQYFAPKKGAGFRKIETLPSYFEASMRGKETQIYQHVSPTVLVNITRDLDLLNHDNATKIVIGNYHAEDAVREFFCQAVPKAPHVCGVFPIELPRQNPTCEWIDYDSIAYEAQKQGILPQNITRLQATADVLRYQETILNKTIDDLPKTCLSSGQLEELRQASYDLEVQFMPFMIETHNDEFEKAKAKGKFCSVDASQVLEIEGWQSFLRNIKVDSKGQRSSKTGRA